MLPRRWLQERVATLGRLWPSTTERRRLLRLWLHRRRQPWRTVRLPAAWRRELRLAFWWTLLLLWLDEPVWLLLGLLAVPAWLVWLGWPLWLRW